MSSMNQDSPAKTTLWRAADDQLTGVDRTVPTPAGPQDPIGSGDNAGALDRRSFMKLMGASVGLASLSGCRRPVETIVPYSKQPVEFVPGRPVYFATTLTRGDDAVGVLVESHEGRPTKIEPNPAHPGSAGGTSSFEQSVILTLADPDRPRNVSQTGGGVRKVSTWDAFLADWKAHGPQESGKGLGILLDPYHSPVMSGLVKQIEQEYPQATIATWAPVSDANLHAGHAAAMGKQVRAVAKVAEAKVILALDSDFLHLETGGVANTRAFSDGRRLETEKTMNRLYVAEHSFTVTGGMADHRWRVRRSEVPGFVAALAQRLANPQPGDGFEAVRISALDAIGTGALPTTVSEAWLGALAADLVQAGKHSLVLAGSAQSASVHAVVAAINAALGNDRTTVSYVEARDARAASLESLQALTAAMAAGEIQTLLIAGPNPVLTAPADLGFAEALGKVGHSVQLSHYYDETSALCGWHLPQSVELESWNAVRCADGTLSVIQPLIKPLHQSLGALDVLSLLLTKQHSSAYELTRAAVSLPSDAAWRRALHNGVVPDSAYAVEFASVNESTLRDQLTGSPLTAALEWEVALSPSPTLYDGRYANNGWMQELPDPATKLVWDNAALMSPRTAAELGVRNEDLVSVTTEAGSLTLPVFVLPGHADKSVSVDLGYGRDIGAVSRGSGFNAYALATQAAFTVANAKVAATSGTYPLSTTQKHHNMHGTKHIEHMQRPLIREGDLQDYIADGNDALLPHVHEPAVSSLWKEHSYEDGEQWGMAIDLNVCTGCNACVTACQSENNIPIVGKENAGYGRELHWIRTDRYFKGDENDPEMRVQPVPCMQCEMAPCEQVCPVSATSHTPDGLNAMAYNRCIGTRYCANNCPYKVRRFNFFNFTKNGPETNVRGESADTDVQRLSQNPDVTVRFRGVMEKCTYCVQRISQARIEAKVDGRPIADGDVKSACQQACPAGAIAFGNIRDETSEVSKQKAKDRNYALLPELLTRPRTTYLAKVRNPNPKLIG